MFTTVIERTLSSKSKNRLIIGNLLLLFFTLHVSTWGGVSFNCGPAPLQVLVLRLRDSVVRLGEELEQSAQAEVRERENARYYRQRLQDTRVEMEELVQREQDSGRRRMELVTRFIHIQPGLGGVSVSLDQRDLG